MLRKIKSYAAFYYHERSIEKTSLMDWSSLFSALRFSKNFIFSSSVQSFLHRISVSRRTWSSMTRSIPLISVELTNQLHMSAHSWSIHSMLYLSVWGSWNPQISLCKSPIKLWSSIISLRSIFIDIVYFITIPPRYLFRFSDKGKRK